MLKLDYEFASLAFPTFHDVDIGRCYKIEVVTWSERMIITEDYNQGSYFMRSRDAISCNAAQPSAKHVNFSNERRVWMSGENRERSNSAIDEKNKKSERH